MISFALARELKDAGFTQSTDFNAVYFLNDHLKIRREDALRMWYDDRSKEGLALDLEREVVYSPTLSELVIGCGTPFYLSCDDTGRWHASKAPDSGERESGETADEAVARLWLVLETKI
jgi:hypothetical protein